MFLSKALPAPRAVEYTELTYEQLQTWFQTAFFSGSEFPVAQASAEKLSPVAAAHRILTNSMSVLPVGLFQKRDGARHPVSDPALDYVLKVRANERMSPALCKKIIMSNAFWQGEGYGWVRKNQLGQVTEIIPLPSQGRSIRYDRENRQYWYDFSVDGESMTFAPSQLLIVFFDTYDGLHGRGMLHLARETISTDGSAQRYGKKFYQNGARMSGIVEVDADLGKPGRDKIKDEFKNYAADREDAFRVAVLDRGYKYNPIGLNQKDAQYIESRGFSVEEVSRFTGIPAYMLQTGKQSYQSNEQQQLDFVTNTLVAHVNAWEQEWTYKLLSLRQLAENKYFRFNVGALLRGDNKSRSEFYAKMVSTAVYCPDDCRAFEEMNPLPGGMGQQFFMTKNLDSLDHILGAQTKK